MTPPPTAKITPLALSCTDSASMTLPWFVEHTEYNPAQATYQPLVNGEEAFGALYDAIEAAQHSVDIICWGFQPSMYFKRGGMNRSLRIGDLLAKKGAQPGFKVRLLCWADNLHMAQFSENNMPGDNLATVIKPNLPDWAVSGSVVTRDSQTPDQRHYDLAWYWRANQNNVTRGTPSRLNVAITPVLKAVVGALVMAEQARAAFDSNVLPKGFPGIELATRDFTLDNRTEIAWRVRMQGVSSTLAMGGEPTHHQKTVLIDYEQPSLALGFVMGHNMLDAYWDRDGHSTVRQEPASGRNAPHPRQDLSSRVSGPLLADLNKNFCQAWDDATGQRLAAARAGITACELPLRRDRDTPVMAQLLRTQSEHGKQDIKTAYLQAVNNATQFIYIENQYFRYLPLADKIKAAVARQITAGRPPDNPVYLFVVTNANDEGIGVGTVNTYYMLDALGCADSIPGIAQLEQEAARQGALAQAYAQADMEATRINDAIAGQQVVQPLFDSYDALTSAGQAVANAYKDVQRATNQYITTHYGYPTPDTPPDDTTNAAAEAAKQQLANARQALQRAQGKQAALQAQMKEPPKAVQPREIPGLKVVVCSLVAPDSAPDNWDYVYVHSKLMIVDDVFTTHGSANINTRSMAVDSELNICHEHAGVTAPLRRRLWNIHTGGMGAQDDPGEAFEAWENIIQKNTDNQAKGLAPHASLIRFLYTKTKRSYAD